MAHVSAVFPTPAAASISRAVTPHLDDAQLGVDDDEEEPDDTHNSHMLGDSDDMELPQLHDSDDEELMALEDQLHSH